MSWEFYNFLVDFNRWVDQDEPPTDFKFWVMAWLYRIQEDPYADAAPADQLGAPWYFAVIPNAEDDTHAVVCLYEINVAAEQVKCSGFSTLRKPVI